MPTGNWLNNNHIVVQPLDEVVPNKGTMLYTWVILPAHIRDGEGEMILNCLYGTKARYNLEQLRTLLDVLCSDNQMGHEMVGKSFDFTKYGDFVLYASSKRDVRLHLYVFCAGIAPIENYSP